MTTFTRHFRTGLIAASTLVLPMFFPSTAVAAPAIPHSEPVLYGTFQPGELCSFAVQILVTDGTKTHDSPGVISITGAFTATITNLNTNTTKTFNISGPTEQDGAVIAGPTLILQPASFNLGPPFLIITHGRVEFNTQGPIPTIASISGKTTDLCAVLS